MGFRAPQELGGLWPHRRSGEKFVQRARSLYNGNQWQCVNLGRFPWPPQEISGEEAQARTRFSGHNEGATKCTGARVRPEPCAAKPEPPDHRARGSTDQLAARGFSYSLPKQEPPPSNANLSALSTPAPHLIPGRSPPAGSVEGESVGTKLSGSQLATAT